MLRHLTAALLFLAPALHAAKPNILFILVDDMGFGDLACYGGVDEPTPNCDKLAAEGTRFTQFYVASPICSPSRVAFTTGMFPARWKISSYLHEKKGNRAAQQADFLDPKAPSIARVLKGAGYATGHFGKWHMGGGRDVTDAPLPSAYGFDESLVNATPLEGMGPALPEGTPRAKTTGLFIDRTLDFIKRQKAAAKPFYVNLWFSEVHDLHVPRPEDADPELKEARKGYPQNMDAFRRTLRGFDRDIGRLMKGLKDLGIDKDTLIIFTGDNGPNPLYDLATRTRTAAMRGQKWSLYEGGIREPFFVRWPDHIPAGNVDQESVVASVDLFPTLCHVAGVEAPEGLALDGEDASGAWQGMPMTRTKPLLWEYGRNKTYLQPKLETDRSPNVAIRDGRWKLLINDDGSKAELYNMAVDPQEKRDLAKDREPIVKRLKEQALEWRRSLPTL